MFATWPQNLGRTSAKRRRLSGVCTSSHNCSKKPRGEWEECVSAAVCAGAMKPVAGVQGGLECVTFSQHFLDLMDASTDVRAL